MPPKSAAELALEKKYELLRKKKQEAETKQAAPAQSNEDPIRAAAVKAVQARRAADEKQKAAAAAAASAAGAKSAAPSPSTAGGLKLKFVIPKRDPDAAAAPNQQHQQQPQQQPQRSKPSVGVKREGPPPAAAGPRNSQPAAAGQDTSRAGQAPPAEAAAGAAEGRAGGGQKRPSAAVRRPTARRPAMQQVEQQLEGEGELPSQPGHSFGAPEEERSAGERHREEERRGYGGSEGGYTGRRGYGGRGGGREEYDDGGGYEGEGYGGGQGGYSDEDEDPYRKRRRGNEGQERDNRTLFVGDLPASWASRDLEDFFSQFGSVRHARVMGSQCYGFVTFGSRQEAEALLESLQEQPLVVEGHGPLRANWAQGSMPEWKKSPAVIRPRAPGEGPGGLESYEHPRVREARLAAQTMLNQQELAAVNLAGPPPSREVVSYDDL